MAAVERGLAGDRCGSGTSAAGEFGLPQVPFLSHEDSSLASISLR
jgi:hypothetical protein